MQQQVECLARFLEQGQSVTVLTGAGVSTASGIPGYRDRDGNWKHTRPVQFSEFVTSARVRRRYWARSFLGWRRIAGARPNPAHQALASLEANGLLDTLITQNVDGLHRRAGNRRVVDLHGRLDTVICLACKRPADRVAWQQRLADANPDWQGKGLGVRPDGDIDLDDDGCRDFRVPACDTCGGIMKPDVVFFGESVPKNRVAVATDAVARAAALLVVGSSLMVFSGFRFARQALETGKPIAILNRGRTRADDMAHLKIDGDCGDVLAKTLSHMNIAAPAAGHAM